MVDLPRSGEQVLTSVDGTKIWAESAGNPTKPALVFIHGFACSAFGFDRQFADQGLLENFHLVRYEMRGHCRSGQPLQAEAYESIRYAEDFKTVCDAFGVEKPFLIGWSLGGVVAADVLNAYGPASLAGIIYCGGGMPHLHYMAATTQPSLQPLIAAVISERAQDMAAASSAFVDSCAAVPLPFPVKLQWMGAFVSQSQVVRVHTLARTQDASEEWERRARGVPVLVVQGSEDRHRDWEGMHGLIERVYADVEVCMLEGIGHTPHFEAPEETNRAIGAWVGKVVARG